MDSVNFNFRKSVDENIFLGLGLNSKIPTQTFDLKTSVFVQ